MSQIRTISRSFFAVAALVMLLVVGMPGKAHAVGSVLDHCDSTSTFNTAVQSAMGNVGYTKTNAATQLLGMFGAIDVKAQYCWSQIQSLFESIGSLASTSMNPFAMIVSAIINAVASQILTLISNACSAVLSTITSFKSFLLSQLNHMCIPLPDLSLGLGHIAGLSFSNAAPCTGGVPLFNFGYTSPGGVGPYSYQRFR